MGGWRSGQTDRQADEIKIVSEYFPFVSRSWYVFQLSAVGSLATGVLNLNNLLGGVLGLLMSVLKGTVNHLFDVLDGVIDTLFPEPKKPPEPEDEAQKQKGMLRMSYFVCVVVLIQ